MPTRDEIALRDKWNLESIYDTDALWEDDFRAAEAMVPEISGYAGTLGQSAARLLGVFSLRDKLGMILEKLWSFAAHRRDEDTTVSKYQGMFERVASLAVRAQAAGAFLVPEILALPAGAVERYHDEEAGLQVYRHHLEDILRARPHTRSAEVEGLLAQASELGRATGDIFDMLDDADMRFPMVKNEDGQEVQLTKGRYQEFMESRNRPIRAGAFKALYSAYAAHRNTLAANLGASVRKDVFFARARNYATSLEAALDPHNIPVAVYHNLLATVQQNLPSLHRYLALRKPLLGVDDLRVYDLYVPLVKEVEWKLAYAEACELILTGLAPLGKEYVSTLRVGLEQGRWVDVYETKGKASGAYSGGGYGTQPFILMNYQNNLSSALVLAHEAGHSMHSYFTRETQPYVYGSYTLFVAEVASTVNESLVATELLRTTSDPDLRMYIINRQAEHFRLTLFRQAMFAEFELAIHDKAERGQPLTADDLSQTYLDLLRKHYGSQVTLDDEIGLEWARIPHFYRPFYVYQYATGISAATALVQRIVAEGQPAVERYLSFLRGGSSQYSIDLLRQAGVDMATAEPVQWALDSFAALVDQMEALVGQKA